MNKIVSWLRNLRKPRNRFVEFELWLRKTKAEQAREYEQRRDKLAREWDESRDWLASHSGS
jgi:hypothetical protein